MALVIDLMPETEARLQAVAAAHGKALGDYVRVLLERAADVASEETPDQMADRYIRGYREQPEGPEEAAGFTRASLAVFAANPWE